MDIIQEPWRPIHCNPPPWSKDVEIVKLDEALSALEEFDPKKARLVELRYFAGLSVPQTAELMGLSERTVKREWAIARGWLFERLDVDREAPSRKP
ncbi:MAG: hypothetical protein LAP38_15725 [Acidobacteriia bacterium]|nr:hypothetical protein [Terriglobia bacterium]